MLMRMIITSALMVGALAALLIGPIPVTSSKKPGTLSDHDRAARAALAVTRSGKVVEVVRETERGATWEVEVLVRGGRKLDVLLDARFRVINVSDEREPSETGAARKGTAVASSKKAGFGRQAHLAAQAAAKAVGGGILIDVDSLPEKNATWEVEFMKLDGKRVSVLLDDKLRVISTTRGKKAN